MHVDPVRAGVPVTERFAHLLVRRRRPVVIFSALLTLLALAVAAGALNVLSLSRIAAPESESDQARAILAERFETGPPNLVFLVDAGDRSVDDPAVRSAADRLRSEIAAEEGVAEVGSYWSRGNSPALRSTDGTKALILVRVPGEVNEARARVGELAGQYAGPRGPLTVQSGGQDEVFREIGAQAREDFVRAEAIVIPMVLLLLVLIYRRIAPALITLGVGIFAAAGALAGLRVLASMTEVSTFAANLALVMGLALGVDYCLFVISRFREELALSNDVGEAVVTAVRTAGRTVFFSGLTVACSLLALLLFPLSFLRSFGFAGVFVVGSALFGSLVMLPAALAMLGRRAVRPIVERPVERGAWFRIAHLVMRRPAAIGGAVLALVLFLAAPALGLRFGLPDARILPADASSRIMADDVRTNFGQEESDAIYLVAPRANDLSRLPQYAGQLSRVEGVAQVDSAAGVFVDGRRVIAGDPERFNRGSGTYLMATPENGVLEGDVGAFVERLRAVGSPYDVMVGGSPAEMLDWRDALTERIPLVLGLILLLSFAVLHLATGSVLLPLKATVLNLLSLGVMFGVMVWVFQDGNLAGLLGFTPTGVLEASRRASSAESVRGSLSFFRFALISSSRAMFSGAETATTCCIRYSFVSPMSKTRTRSGAAAATAPMTRSIIA
jgi:RND superfamily putative drug exporter